MTVQSIFTTDKVGWTQISHSRLLPICCLNLHEKIELAVPIAIWVYRVPRWRYMLPGSLLVTVVLNAVLCADSGEEIDVKLKGRHF